MRAWTTLLLMAISIHAASAEEPVRLYAAGSLRAAMTDVAAVYTAATGAKVDGTYGPSGLLRGRIERGEPAEVFASANMEHAQALAKSGKAGPVAMFAHNRLCALVAPGVRVSSATLLERLLDPKVKLGTSTPKADPSGDYAWKLFERAERVRAGACRTLSDKALKLTGGPDSAPAPNVNSPYAHVVSTGQADIFLTYCTNAVLAGKEVPSLQVVQVPEELAVGADYGLTVIGTPRPEALRFALFILSTSGQQILQRHGFTAVGLP
ncbi:MAG: molybdate ABC transporter substrate-binding protein [Arenicellales bacterium]